MPLLQADAADVNTTKLMSPAATGIPMSPKVFTKGLSDALSSVHGLIHSKTKIAPT